MPKKVTRYAHVRETASTAAATTTGPVEKPKRRRSVHIEPRNGRRWLSLKKRLGFPTDDELVVYLLDLADSIISHKKEDNHEMDDTGKISKDSMEKELPNIVKTVNSKQNDYDSEIPRRSQRNQVISEESQKNEKFEKTDKAVNFTNNLEKLSIQDSKSKSRTRSSKTKRHKNKARHHKEKRKKRKHQKFKDVKDLLIMESRTNNKVLWQLDSESDTDQSMKKLQNNFISETLILNSNKTEAVLDKSVHEESSNDKCIKVYTDVKNIDVPYNENPVAKVYNEEQVEINTVQNFTNQDSSFQNIAEESNKFLVDSSKSCQSSIIHSTNILSDKKNEENSKLTHKILNNKYDHSKYDYNQPCDLLEKKNKSDEIPINKRDKKRLKGDYQSKKYHDVRKAPQSGIADENQDLDSSRIDSLPINSIPIVPENNTLQCKEIINNTVTEPPRLAIKIKLCQECNSRHLQNACPLTEPSYTIKDSISIEQWLEKYSENSEVMKAFSCIDPMSQGYTKYGEDGIESDEDILEQDKRKMKIEYEEKQQNIDSNRPLYARESLPECLELKVSNIEHGLGVYVKSLVPMFAQLGPLIGKPVQEMDIPDDFPMRHIWEIDVNNKTLYISTTNPLTSNWIRYVRPAETKEDRNVAVISKNGELFLVTSKSLIAGTELTYWSDSQSTAWTRKNKIDKTNCGGCNLNFLHPIYYRLHCCIFHDTNYSLTIRKYHCKVCGAAVLGKDNIMKHAAQLHAGRGAYQCQYCKKFFLRLNYLEMHRTYGCSQNPQRSRPLCDFCGRKFCQPQKLKVHIKRMHSDMSEVLREFQCKLCLKLLGSRAALQRHMKEVHHKDVVGAATCDRCGKMFQNKSNLKIHMLTHSGVKPFKCKENGCKAAFTTKQCLQFHYKKVHGLSEEMMPKIERSVAYTFDAYSGGLVEDVGRGKTPKFNVKNVQDNSDSLASFDDCSSENNNTSSAAEMPCESNKQIKENDQPNLLMSMTATTVNSPIESAESDIDLYGTSRTTNKVNKKWLGEFDPISNTQSATSATDIYDFQENRSIEEKIHSSNQNLMDDSKLVLNMYRRTESANASLLVEAALDAAERDIGAVTSPILEDSDREANLYSISNELDFKTSCSQSEVVNRSPEGHLDSYMQDELSPSPGRHTHSRHTPDHVHLDYHIARPVDYVSPTNRTHNIEQYLDHQDIQHVIHVSQEISTSPTRYQEISQSNPVDHCHSHLHGPLHPLPLHHDHNQHHHHHQHQQQPQQQQKQVANEALSSDEGDSVAQNLSLSIKEKTLQQLDLVKYDGLESDFSPVSRDRVRFESLIVQAPEDQGLDMTARGFHQTFESQVQNNNNTNSNHHHHLYGTNERERQGVDLSRTSGCISPPLYASHYPSSYPVDIPRVVSLESPSRSHHLHTSVSRIISSPQQTSSLTSHILTETLEARIISPPPPPIPTYNSTYSVGPTPYSSRSGYHYSGYY